MFEPKARSLLASMFVAAALAVCGCGSPGTIDFDPKPEAQPVQPVEPARPKPLPEIQNGVLLLAGPISFESGTQMLRSESTEVLVDVQRFLEAKPDVTLLRIEGHTDDEGDPLENQRLSGERAMSVARWLVSQGIDCRRLLPVAFGSMKPIAANDTPDNKAQNRRISFVIAALRGRPIGGMPVDGNGAIAGDPCR